MSVGNNFYSILKGQGTTCTSSQLIRGLIYRHRQPTTLRFTPKVNLGSPIYLKSLLSLLLLLSSLLVVAAVAAAATITATAATSGAQQQQQQQSSNKKHTCELADAVRQPNELIVGQVKFLQTGETAHTGRKVFQLVVGQVLERRAKITIKATSN